MLPKPAGMSGAEARAILRSAVRSHPNAASVTHGRMVNSLTVAELHLCLNTLGVDVARLLAHPGQAPATIETLTIMPDDDDDTARPEDDAQPEDAQPDPIETELAAIRGLVVSGGFGALDDRLRSLLIAANKPPVTVTIEVPAPVAGAPSDIPQAKQTGATVTWGSVFGVTGALASRTVHMWDGAHPDTPKVNSRYQWPQPQTSVALAMLARQRNVLAFGPAGTGKTEFACQLAARLGRPFALVSCDSGTDAATLVGMTVPGKDGGVTWQDGQLTRAIQTPGCVICIDEPSVARPGALFVLQNILANRVLFIAETGRRVPVAPGVLVHRLRQHRRLGRRGAAGLHRHEPPQRGFPRQVRGARGLQLAARRGRGARARVLHRLHTRPWPRCLWAPPPRPGPPPTLRTSRQASAFAPVRLGRASERRHRPGDRVCERRAQRGAGSRP
jgi:hypothetical protein